MQEYGAKGVDIGKLIDKKLESVEQRHPGLSDSELRELAHEEVIADSLQRMFTDTDVLSKIEKLKAQDHKLWQKLKDFLANLQAKIKELYNEFDSQSREAALVKQMGDAVDTLADMFAEALVDAGNVQESVDIAETENEISVDSNNAVKNSNRNVEKGKKSYYNEFNTLAMQWANNIKTAEGDYKSFYDGRKHKWCLIAADKNSDGGYRIVTFGNYEEVNELEQIYNTENDSFDRYAEAYNAIKRTDINDLWESPNREMFRQNSKNANSKQGETERNTATGNDEYVRSSNRGTNDKVKFIKKNEHKYSFGGRNSKTANTSLLASAQEMESKGKDSEDIRQETGWFRGYDGGWRYEINDYESSLIEDPKLKIYNDKNGITFYGKISDVLNHKDLFKAYPKLKNVNFVINTLDSGVDGAYLTDSNYICLNLELFKRNTKEYQDYYDKHLKAEVEKIESTPEYKEYSAIVEDTENYFANYKEWRKLTDAAIKKFFSSELGKRYYELKWGDNGFKGEKTEFGWDKGAKSVLMHELQHAIQLIEGFEDGTYGDDENYYNNAGEHEARDVQTRLDYTAEQRKSIRPNVDRTDVTFRKSVLSHPPDNQSENIDNLNSVKDRDIRYSDRKKYWRTGMSSVEISNILRVAKRQMNNGNNYIDDATKWLYTIYSGKEYFALYSTADAETEPTILYASKGNKAAKENEWINNVLQESGDENNDIVRSRESVSAILRVHRNEQDNDFVDNRKSADRQRSNKNTGIYRKNANYRPDSALLTCLENIEGGRRERNKYRGIDIFELDNTKFSERGSQYAKELEEVNKQITKENEKLKEDVSDLKELLKMQAQETHGKMLKKTSIEAVAKKIMRESNANGNVSDFASLIKDVYNYIINGENVNYETIKEKAELCPGWAQALPAGADNGSRYASTVAATRPRACQPFTERLAFAISFNNICAKHTYCLISEICHLPSVSQTALFDSRSY